MFPVKILLLLMSCVCTLSLFSQRNIISGALEKIGIDSLLQVSEDFQPFPAYNNRAEWNAVSPEVKENIVQEGAQYINYDWPTLTAGQFLEYSINGNRSNYQVAFFKRRQVLSSLVLAECAEYSGRFIKDIINGVWAICEESYWGLPAHLYLQKDSIGLPEITEPTVDLFAAETGNLLAWTHYFLKEKFDSVSPLINRRIINEVSRRVLRPNLERDDFWWMGFGERIPNNWNPWINSNWLGCVFILEKNKEKKKAALEKIARSLDVFLNNYPADGGCDEGPGYWSFAGGSLLGCLELLRAASNKTVDVYKNILIQNMGDYLNKARIEDDFYINFADAPAKLRINPFITFLYGMRTGNHSLMQLGASAAREQGVSGGKIRGDIFRKLQTIFHFSELKNAEVKKTYLDDFFLPDLQVFGARSGLNTSKGFFVAGKGGHNDESHNHNDIGNAIVYYDGKPVLIDVGVEAYTSKTFSDKRYDIWTMQSAYHNVPFINGYMQHAGREYAAKKVHFEKKKNTVSFSLDLQSAYPGDADIKYWRRSMVLNRKMQYIDISDQFELKSKKGETFFTFMTPCPVIQQKDRLLLKRDSTDIQLLYDPKQLRAEVEEIKVEDAQLKSVWNDRLFRIKLQVSDFSLKQSITIRVKSK